MFGCLRLNHCRSSRESRKGGGQVMLHMFLRAGAACRAQLAGSAMADAPLTCTLALLKSAGSAMANAYSVVLEHY